MRDMAMGESILQDTTSFFKDLFDNIRTGILFFGGPFDILLTILDILITTLVIYFLLKLIRDSRAWQLLKGILLIVILAQLFTILGLQTIGFILSSTLSVLAIAFVVLFQPELRRTLETVGRNSFHFLSGMISQDAEESKNVRYSLIDAIVRATARMASSRTGALIILERDTKLGELAEQENAVILDSVVSASMLLQIFYKGSPLHDGAVLIRDGRIYAARCHVPLSDNYHLRRDYGTRHRAAIGVSEMGDAIAIVVSEERGTVSIAINGRLYSLDNPDALRSILHRQLGSAKDSGVLAGIIKGTMRKKGKGPSAAREAAGTGPSSQDDAGGDDGISQAIDESGQKSDIPYRRNWNPLDRKGSSYVLPKKNKILMMLSSLFLSVLLWLYVLIMINPVETKEFSVAVTVQGIESLSALGLTPALSSDTIKIEVAGRSKNLKNLSSDSIEAIIDLTDITSAQTISVPVSVKVRKLAYFEIRKIYPARVTAEIDPSQG